MERSSLHGVAKRIVARRTLAVFAFGLLAVALRTPVGADEPRDGDAQTSKVGSGLAEQIENDGNVVVLIHLRPRRVGGSAVNSDDGVAEFREQIARVQDSVLEILEEDEDTRVRYQYEYVPGLAIEVDDIALLERVAELPEVESIHADIQGGAALFDSLSYIRVGEAQQLGVDGSGVTVAVLDSGIEYGHPALEDARLIQHEARFLDQGDDQGGDERPIDVRDGNSHGTNVAGIIVSRGTPDGDVPAGVAPRARVISIKVLKDDASGWVSDWTRGVEEVIRIQETEGAPHIDVVNMSLVIRTDYESVEECEAVNGAASFVAACREAVRSGATLVGASGNRGAENAVTLPACFSSVIAVGSVADGSTDAFGGDADDVSPFTNRGDMLELLAPGERIVSTGLISQNYVSVKSGTSQACPHAAGVICLMKQANPNLDPSDVREILGSTGRMVVDQEHRREYPVVDARRALERVSTPRIESFLCDTSDRPLTILWELQGFASTQRIRITRDGSFFLDRFLSSDVRRFDASAVGSGDYDVVLEVFSSHIELGGDSANCRVVVSSSLEFRRGDCTGDGFSDISDVMGLLWSTFAGVEIELCEVACDANDDNEVDISDAVYLLDHIFGNRAPPLPPYNACGIDPTEGPLGCDVSPCGQDA
jgi:subtilisin family serine protease